MHIIDIQKFQVCGAALGGMPSASALFSAACLGAHAVRPRPDLRSALRIIGHRGASAVSPENTVGAFRAAIAAGAAGFEMDVQLLRDGVPCVLHDDTLRRTGGASAVVAGIADTPVSELTFAEVSAIDVGSWYGEEWSAERPPSLAQALRLISGARRRGSRVTSAAHTLCELKTAADFSFDARLPDAVAAVAAAERVRGSELSWISFSLPLLEQMKAIAPSHSSLLLGDARTEEEAWGFAEAAVGSGLDGVDLNADPAVVTPELVRWLRRRGKIVAVWVGAAPAANDVPEVWSVLGDAGVHTLTSNMPENLIPWLGGASAPDSL